MLGLMTPPRILSLLIALALLLMPVGMVGGGPATAASHDMTMAAGSHCADQPQPSEEQPPRSCCMVACAAFLAEPPIVAAAAASPLPYRRALSPAQHGLTAEADTPPPRLS
jgi:hypothetical protein